MPIRRPSEEVKKYREIRLFQNARGAANRTSYIINEVVAVKRKKRFGINKFTSTVSSVTFQESFETVQSKNKMTMFYHQIFKELKKMKKIQLLFKLLSNTIKSKAINHPVKLDKRKKISSHLKKGTENTISQ